MVDASASTEVDPVDQLFSLLCELSPAKRQEMLPELGDVATDVLAEVVELLAFHDEARSVGFLDVVGTAEPCRATLAGDLLLGRLRIQKELGRGSFGRVYLAEDEDLKRPVALKVMMRQGAEEPVQREARAIARLSQHPGIVTLYGIHSPDADDQPWVLEMEYISGGTLEQRLRDRWPTLDEAVDLARQVATALAAVHAEQVVHGDLKPANCLIDGSGRLRLADFGMSSFLEPGGMVSPLGGTPLYMAPEQVSQRATRRSDVWAFGVILYRLLSRRYPFVPRESAELFSLCHALLSEQPASLPGAIPPYLRALVKCCLEKDPERRPSDAGEVLALLQPRPAAGQTPTRPRVPLGDDLVGRERELALLQGAIAGVAEAGPLGLVLLRGSAGSGKTLLATRGREFALEAGLHVVETSLGGAEGLLRPLVRGLLRELEARAPHAEVDMFVRRSAQAIAYPSEDAATHGDPLWILIELSAALAGDGGLVVIFDDAGAAEAEDHELLAHYLEHLSEVAALGLIAWNETQAAATPPPLPREGVLTIPLAPLDEDASYRLLLSRGDVDTIEPALANRLLFWMQGNPRRGVELLRYLDATGGTARQGRRLITGAAFDEEAVAGVLQDLVGLRVANLALEDRELLDAAAVCGHGFTADEIQVALGTGTDAMSSPRELFARLQRLHRTTGLLVLTPDGFRFDEPLTREVLYAGVAPVLRRVLHAGLAALLERHPEGNDAERIASHWEHAGEPERAHPHLLRAIRQAERRQEGARVLELAARCGLQVTAVPAGATTGEIEALLSCAIALADTDRRDEASALFTSLGEATRDEAQRARIEAFRARLLMRHFGLAAFDAHWNRRASDILAPTRALGHAHLNLAHAARIAEQYDEALVSLRRAHDVYAEIHDPGGVSSALNQQGQVRRLQDAQEDALQLFTQAASISAGAGRRLNGAISQANAALASLGLGRFDGLDELLAGCERTFWLRDVPSSELHVRVLRAHAHIGGGHLREADELMQSTRDDLRNATAEIVRCYADAAEAETAGITGDLARASRLLDRAEPLARGAGLVDVSRTCQALRIIHACWAGDVQTAEELSRQVADLEGAADELDFVVGHVLWAAMPFVPEPVVAVLAATPCDPTGLAAALLDVAPRISPGTATAGDAAALDAAAERMMSHAGGERQWSIRHAGHYLHAVGRAAAGDTTGAAREFARFTREAQERGHTWRARVAHSR